VNKLSLALQVGWPHVTVLEEVRGAWTVGRDGERVCMKHARGDIICLQPGGYGFFDVWVASESGASPYGSKVRALGAAVQVLVP
jgi:hypothetical protein